MYIESLHGERARALRNGIARSRSLLEAGGIEPAVIDAVLLKARHALHQGTIDELRLTREARAWFLGDLRTLAEDGRIAVIEGGMDCDCVSYSGRVHMIDATVEAYNALDERVRESADGPYHFELARPSIAAGVKYRSRDLALEAYENGHPHRIEFAMPEDD